MSIRGKDFDKVYEEVLDELREKKSREEKRRQAQTEIVNNSIRDALEAIELGFSRNELLQDDMPYITAAEALDLTTKVSNHSPSDDGIRLLKAELFVEYGKNDMKVYTVNEIKKLAGAIQSKHPSSNVFDLVKRGFANVSVFEEDYEKFKKLASQVKSQEDYERVCLENGLIGDDLKTFRGQALIAKLAQMNMEDPSEEEEVFTEDMPEAPQEDAEAVTSVDIPSPNSGEMLNVTVTQVGEGDMEFLGQVDEVYDNLLSLDEEDPLEEEGASEDEASETSEFIDDPSSPGDTIEITLDTADSPEKAGPEDESEATGGRWDAAIRQRIRKLLRRDHDHRRSSGKNPAVLFFNHEGSREKLGSFRFYNMEDALKSISQFAIESGLSGKVYANNKEAAIVLDSGNLVTFYLGKTDYGKLAENLTYKSALNIVSDIDTSKIEDNLLGGNIVASGNINLSLNDKCEYVLSYKGKKVRKADINDFDSIMKDFIMEAALDKLKHSEEEPKEIQEEMQMFIQSFDEPLNEKEEVELDNGFLAEIEVDEAISVVKVTDLNGDTVELTPELEDEALSKYNQESESSLDEMKSIGAIQAMTYKCAHCGSLTTSPMPREAMNMDCNHCGKTNSKSYIASSLKELNDVHFNYLFNSKNPERLANAISNKGLYSVVSNGMVHVAEDDLSLQEIIEIILDEIKECEPETEASGPLGGDGQGIGPQPISPSLPNQDLRQTPVPGVQEQQKELIKYDMNSTIPNQIQSYEVEFEHNGKGYTTEIEANSIFDVRANLVKKVPGSKLKSASVKKKEAQDELVEEQDMMPVPMSAPDVPEAMLPSDGEPTLELEQAVDDHAYIQISSAFRHYRHEGLGPAEAIKKFMSDYDEENYNQSQIIKICGEIYTDDPVSEGIDFVSSEEGK